jgi:hypothetical protein
MPPRAHVVGVGVGDGWRLAGLLILVSSLVAHHQPPTTSRRLATENVDKELNKVAELRRQGASQQKIADKLHSTRSKIRNILMKIGESHLANVGETAGDMGDNPKPPFSPVSPTSLPVSSPNSPAVSRQVASKEQTGVIATSLERKLIVEATPIIEEVALNPRMCFWCGFARNKLGF